MAHTTSPDIHPPPFLSMPHLSMTEFASRARRRLHASPPDPGLVRNGHRPSDFDLNPGHESGFPLAALNRPAAVLVPVVAHAEPTLLFTERTATLSSHAGQISFPGGHTDGSDSGPGMTALRETFEEVGLPPSAVRPLGYLDCYRTGTGYIITPCVGLIEPGYDLVLNAGEVADVFEVPLSFLMDEANHKIDIRTIQGVERQFYAIDYKGRYIWGATAGILRNLYERLFRP